MSEELQSNVILQITKKKRRPPPPYTQFPQLNATSIVINVEKLTRETIQGLPYFELKFNQTTPNLLVDSFYLFGLKTPTENYVYFVVKTNVNGNIRISNESGPFARYANQIYKNDIDLYAV